MKNQNFPKYLFLLALLFCLCGLGTSSSLAQNKGKNAKKKKPEPFAWSNPITEQKRKYQKLSDHLQHATFKSPSMKKAVGYCIYLPEEYDKNKNKKYPVVFHLHGGRPGSELKSIKLATFVEIAIKNGDIQPTIYIFPNGGPMSWYNYPQKEQAMGEDVFINELIPHIKETYRTREMAIEGFSQGGRGTTRIMFRHPHLFVSAAPGGSGYEPEKRIQENNGAESEKVVFAKGYNTWDLADEYAKKQDKKTSLPIALWVGTKGFNYEFNLKFSNHLKQLGISHQKIVAEDVGHSAFEMYQKKGLELMQFHQQHFAKK